MTRELTQDTEHEEQLNEVLLQYLEDLEAGRSPDREQLLAAHPHLRTDLESFFVSRDEVTRLATPLRATSRAFPSLEGSGLSNILRSSEPTRNRSGDERDRTTPDIGQLGDFRILREIGRGGMGVVYEAEQISLRRRVALKVLPFAAAIDERQIQRFKNEALAAAHLQHANIVPVYAVGCDRGVHFYAMQFIEGQSLSELIGDLREMDSAKGRLTEAQQTLCEPVIDSTDASLRHSRTLTGEVDDKTEGSVTRTRSTGNRAYFETAARLGRQAAFALEYAHQTGIVHRDIKPSNLLLDALGQLWVTDFGLAQIGGDGNLTATGELLGTLRYASPEQAQARRGIVDHRSDIYSLGATLYELITLRPVFDGRDRVELLRQIIHDDPQLPRSLDRAIPEDLETIILKSLRKEPAERYATAEELADDLQRFLENRPIQARRPTLVERARKWGRRHPSVVAASIVVLLLVSVGSLISAAIIRVEQGKATAAQKQTQDALERERERAKEAEARFRLARRSVDELIRFSEEELAHRPGTEGLRKRLLVSALAYYQELAVQRQKDPAAQAELIESQKRVSTILSDLSVLRASQYLYLLAQPSVLDELCHDPEERAKIEALAGRIGNRWLNSQRDFKNLSRAERNRQTLERAWSNEAEVNAVLSRDQLRRLLEIALQWGGTAAFQDPDVIAALELTRYQRERILEIVEKTSQEYVWNSAASARFQPGTKRQRLAPATPMEQILEVLSDQQKKRWNELTGKPFTGSVPQFAPFARPKTTNQP